MLLVTEALDNLGIPYLVGGSLASIIHGVIRTTGDVDLVVEMQPAQAAPSCSDYGGNSLLTWSRCWKRSAIKAASSYFHPTSFFRIDVFVSQQRPFDLERFRRRQELPVSLASSREASISSAEGHCAGKAGVVPDWGVRCPSVNGVIFSVLSGPRGRPSTCRTCGGGQPC